MSGPFRFVTDIVTGVLRVPAGADPTGAADTALDITEDTARPVADTVDDVVGGIVGSIFDAF